MASEAVKTINEADEAAMRDAKVPWFDNADDLTAYIAALIERSHDYGTSAYAMSLAAVAAFNYVGKRLGTTGFQSSCADMDFLRRTRGMERFIVLDIGNALYPQYDLPARLTEAIDAARPWLAEQAAAKLRAETAHAHPSVIAHWRRLAEPVPA